MKEIYNHKEIESVAQQYWQENQSFKAVEDNKKESFIVYLCFHILQGSYIWGMLEIILSVML